MMNFEVTPSTFGVRCSLFIIRRAFALIIFFFGVSLIHSIFAALANSAGEVDEWLKSTVC
jgi:hypothetical protein